jgi:hypothetical protein
VFPMRPAATTSPLRSTVTAMAPSKLLVAGPSVKKLWHGFGVQHDIVKQSRHLNKWFLTPFFSLVLLLK